MTHNKGNKTISILRWIARIWAALMAVLMIIIFIGESRSEGI